MLRGLQLRGAIHDDCHVLFANTGKEREETLEFVRDCGEAWGVQIHWLERLEGPGFVEVDFATASRDGKPFADLITKRKFLPNPVARYCTQELKVRVMRDWMKARGYEHWTNFVGIRADEPRRVSRIRNSTTRERFDVALPLAEWGTTIADIEAFWAEQPFTLRLQQHEGNCDLCFLKAAAKRVTIANSRPDLAAWWHEQERRMGQSFRSEGTLQQHIDLAAKRKVIADQQGDLFTCFCGDDAEAA